MFTAVLAQPPSVSDRFVARRARLDRLSLPLGSSFLITAPPQVSFALVLKVEKQVKRRNLYKGQNLNVEDLNAFMKRTVLTVFIKIYMFMHH